MHVFAGPTLTAGEILEVVPDAVLHPPVAHGDLLRLPADPEQVVVLIDGLFHHAAAVRHKEILELLARGVRVVGCSSMGALRAAELHPFGMIGHGAVFDLYRTGVVESDDEVAVTHAEALDFRRLSESAITFRHLTGQATRAGVLDAATADRIMSVVRSLPYPTRPGAGGRSARPCPATWSPGGSWWSSSPGSTRGGPTSRRPTPSTRWAGSAS